MHECLTSLRHGRRIAIRIKVECGRVARLSRDRRIFQMAQRRLSVENLADPGYCQRRADGRRGARPAPRDGRDRRATREIPDKRRPEVRAFSSAVGLALGAASSNTSIPVPRFCICRRCRPRASNTPKPSTSDSILSNGMNFSQVTAWPGGAIIRETTKGISTYLTIRQPRVQRGMRFAAF